MLCSILLSQLAAPVLPTIAEEQVYTDSTITEGDSVTENYSSSIPEPAPYTQDDLDFIQSKLSRSKFRATQKMMELPTAPAVAAQSDKDYDAKYNAASVKSPANAWIKWYLDGSNNLHFGRGTFHSMKDPNVVPENLRAKLTAINTISFDQKASIRNKDSLWNAFNGQSMKEIIGFENLDSTVATSLRDFASAAPRLVKLDLSKLNTPNVTNLNGMFNNDPELLAVRFGGKFTTSKVTTMNWMFNTCKKFEAADINKLDVSNVTDMRNAFRWTRFNNVSAAKNWNTSKVTSIAGVFASILYPQNVDLSGWNLSKAPETSLLFRTTEAGFPAGVLQNINLSNVDFTATTSMHDMFALLPEIVSVNLTGIKAPNLTSMRSMFNGSVSTDPAKGTSKLSKITFGPNFPSSKVTDMAWMFNNTPYLQLSNVDLANLNTNAVTDFTSTFSAGQRPSITVPWTFQGAKKMQQAFFNNKITTEINLPNMTLAADPAIDNLFKGDENVTKFTLGQNLKVPTQKLNLFTDTGGNPMLYTGKWYNEKTPDNLLTLQEFSHLDFSKSNGVFLAEKRGIKWEVPTMIDLGELRMGESRTTQVDFDVVNTTYMANGHTVTATLKTRGPEMVQAGEDMKTLSTSAAQEVYRSKTSGSEKFTIPAKISTEPTSVPRTTAYRISWTIAPTFPEE